MFALQNFLQKYNMMEFNRLISFMIVVMVVSVAAKETYTTKYDNIDVREIAGNRKLLLAYVNCVMERGKCTPEGNELKKNLREAIETGCEKCTKAQEDGTKIIIEHLIKHELEIWRELCAKFDPDGKWRKVYEARARENGIIIPE